MIAKLVLNQSQKSDLDDMYIYIYMCHDISNYLGYKHHQTYPLVNIQKAIKNGNS